MSIDENIFKQVAIIIIIIIIIIITIFVQGAHFTKSDIQWGPVKQQKK